MLRLSSKLISLTAHRARIISSKNVPCAFMSSKGGSDSAVTSHSGKDSLKGDSDSKPRDYDLQQGDTEYRKLTPFQRRYIYFALKHKTMADIPDVLPASQIALLYTRARITVNMMMGVVTLVVCIVALTMGKNAAARGENITKMNLDMHKKYNEEYRAKQEAEASLAKK